MISNLPAQVKERRANANPALVGAWAAVFSMFATVPISIRQRDWKVCIIPLIFMGTCLLAAVAVETNEEKVLMKVLAYSTSGVAAAALVKQNKDEAQK